MRTTIQISNDLRKKLKVIASEQDISYEQALEQLLSVFETCLPFRSEREFAKYFEDNLELFDFKEVIEKRPKGYPDYRLLDNKGKEVEVELELIGESFRHHKHDPKKADLIVCLFSNEKIIEGVKVVSVINPPEEKDDFIRYKRGNYTTINLPNELAKKAKDLIDGTGFKNLSDFVAFILREMVAQGNNDNLDESKAKVIDRLKNLGYL